VSINYHYLFSSYLLYLCSIAVVSDIGGLGVACGTASVGSLGGITVGLDSGFEGFLTSSHVLCLALPCLEDGGLQSTTI